MKEVRKGNGFAFKRITGIIVLVLFAAFFLGACNPQESEEKYYLGVDKDAKIIANKYGELLEELLVTTKYMYSTSIYRETLSNFDYETKEMPQHKAESEKKKWSKPEIEYLYIKQDSKEYVKIEYKDVKKQDNGEIEYEDSSFKKPVFKEMQVAEYWFDGDDLLVKVDNIQVYSGNIDLFERDEFEYDVLTIYEVVNSPDLLKNCLQRYDDYEKVKDSVFFAENKKVFSNEILFTKYIDVIKAEERLPYRNSLYASGYAEDFSVKWEDVDYIDVINVCVTAKKSKITQLEYNSEKIASYKREIVQLWNNERNTSWYGDRIDAEKMVIEVTYDSTKSPISIPRILHF